jgi:cell wall-associated NlpC family hydrolase
MSGSINPPKVRSKIIASLAGAALLSPIMVELAPSDTAQAASADPWQSKAARIALKQNGKRYAFGAAGPNAFDCSGLVKYAYRKAGVSGIPRTTYGQVHVGHAVSRKNLRPGDLVFSGPGHVEIYYGHGRVVYAATPSEGVKTSTIWHFWKARRIGRVSAWNHGYHRSPAHPKGTAAHHKSKTHPKKTHHTATHPASAKTVTVRRGDTLGKIASRYHMGWKKLWKLNRKNVPNPNVIRVGQTLQLSTKAHATKASYKAAHHKKNAKTVTVHRGDTLGKIASRHHMGWKHLWKLNRKKVPNPNLIHVGQTLRL